jgi:hypothetical protein
MKNRFGFFIIMLVAVSVGAWLYCALSSKQSCIVNEVHTTDTVFSYHYETLYIEKPIIKDKCIIDTIYLKDSVGNSFTIPIEQKKYSSQKLYDIWVSGFNVNVDSVKLYPLIRTETVTNERIVFDNNPKLYVFGGFNALQGDIIPKVGVSLSLKNKWLISPEIGFYKNNINYGISVGKEFDL